ncbi:S8 family serine peptidase [Rhodoplanes sp. SY1]|uniref:S8 family serine peptidase n=1 Tax=Rhodoplanes sp. SY1 TaxID=3166646 RepID=UPI0038B693BE
MSRRLRLGPFHALLGVALIEAALVGIALLAAVGTPDRALAQALPTGGTVTSGTVGITQPNGSTLVINQTSPTGIVHWSTFSIGTGGTVNFNNGSGATLNRVTGNVPSSIDGLLTGTGSVFLVNPAGIAVGPNGVVQTGGSFVASTLDVKDSEFLARGTMTFDGTSTAAVVNLGRIGSSTGDVVLIARTVQNDGVIEAPQGTAAMASGREVVLSDGSLGNGKVHVRAPGGDGKVINRGTIRAADVELRANGGNVYALAGNTDGVIKATGIANKGGRIFLTAQGGTVTATQRMVARRAPTTTTTAGVTGSTSRGGDILIEADAVSIAGHLDATGDGAAGGRIVVTGGTVTLAAGALLDASGTAGGTVLVGGDRAGGRGTIKYSDTPVRNADQVTIESGATIRADGTAGAGGNIVVWSEGTTTVAGTISAVGTTAGGFIETSGKTLNFAGASINAGQGGTWLLDPDDLIIDTNNVGAIVTALNAGTNVIQETTQSGTGGYGDITVATNIAWSTSATLTLSAYRNIVFQSGAVITNTGAGKLILRADNTGTGIGTVVFPLTGTAVDFANSTGSVSIYFNPSSYTSTIELAGFTSAVNVGSNATLTSYMLVNSVADLAAIEDNPSGTYALGRDIDATYFAGVPVTFNGVFDGWGGIGANRTISNLGKHTSSSGLFRSIGSYGIVRNLVVAEAEIAAGYYGASIGVLAEENFGLIQNVLVTGKVDGGAYDNVRAGGLVGRNYGLIIGAVADVDVTTDGEAWLGGLVGSNAGSGDIYASFAFGNVTAGPNASYGIYGGLVGKNEGSILYSGAAGDVTGGDHSTVGGLVGYNADDSYYFSYSPYYGSYYSYFYSYYDAYYGAFPYGGTGTIYGSIATGTVSAGANSIVGGLIGDNHGAVVSSSATGSVIGGADSSVGGLIGENVGLLAFSAASGGVSGGTGSDVGGAVGLNHTDGVLYRVSAGGAAATTGVGGTAGGLVGYNEGAVLQSFASGAVSGDSGTAIGGLIGANVPSSTWDDAIVYQSYATGAVTGTGTAIAGGLIGINAGYVEQTYATGAVTTGSGGIVGGLVGVNQAQVSYDPPLYSTVTGTVVASYWDTQTSGQSSSAAGTGLTTAQLTSGLPAGFDPDVWSSVPGQSYPFIFGGPTYNPGPGTDPTPPQIYDPGLLVSLVSLNPTNTVLGPPDPNQTNITPPAPPTTTGGNGAGGGRGNRGAGGPGGNNPGGGPPPGPGLDRTPSEQQMSGVPPIGETRFIPNEIVLQIPASVSRSQVEAIARALGVDIAATETIGLTGRTVYTFQMKAGQDIRALIRQLEQNRIVSSAQPNYVYNLAQAGVPAGAPATGTPASDPAADTGTGSIPPNPGGPETAASGSSDLASDLAARTTLPTGDPAQYVIQKLGLGAVHKRVRGANVTVAVIDSEIDLRHPDLQGVPVEHFDATGAPSRPHTHGTGMAGAIASRTRLLGVAPGIRLLAVRAFSENDKSAEATTTQVMKGLDWAIAKNPRIINMSFAGPRDLMTERLLEAASKKGIVLVAAAGNAGPKSPPLYPAADPNVIAVSATDNDDKPFVQANRGKHIAVAAPGVDVLVPSPEGAYQLTTGTSVAAAHVSGVAALLIEARPSLTPADVRGILTRTAKPLGPGKDVQVGAGLIDPIRSLAGVAPAATSQIAPPPLRPGVMPAMPLR